MKIKWNQKYTLIALYSFLVLTGSIIFYLIASEVTVFRSQISNILSIFTPFIIGFVMAYLFNFIMVFFEKTVFEKVDKLKNMKRKRGFAVLLTYIVVVFFMYLFLKFIFPQLLESIVGLVNDIPGYVITVTNKFTEITDSFSIDDSYSEIILEKWDDFIKFFVNFATNLVPIIGNMTRHFVSSIWNIVLGFIISIYLLMDKENFFALIRKTTYGLLPEPQADFAIELTHRGDRIFGQFLGGKILDSLIIGVLTFAVLFIFKMPYAPLIAFIIGLTNIIPFFGPFIGAVPSFFIIAFESFPMALWFLLIIFVIQQIDGNIIGPKILGDSLGISAFWILFSLLVGGKLFGFLGLIIGVPLFVFVYSIIKDFVEKRLRNKGLPENTEEYIK